MGELSPWHWAVVILIAVLLFGSRRLPDAARSLGRSARILRAEMKGMSDDRAAEAPPAPAPGVPQAVTPPAVAPPSAIPPSVNGASATPPLATPGPAAEPDRPRQG